MVANNKHCILSCTRWAKSARGGIKVEHDSRARIGAGVWLNYYINGESDMSCPVGKLYLLN